MKSANAAMARDEPEMTSISIARLKRYNGFRNYSVMLNLK